MLDHRENQSQTLPLPTWHQPRLVTGNAYTNQSHQRSCVRFWISNLIGIIVHSVSYVCGWHLSVYFAVRNLSYHTHTNLTSSQRGHIPEQTPNPCSIAPDSHCAWISATGRITDTLNHLSPNPNQIIIFQNLKWNHWESVFSAEALIPVVRCKPECFLR